MHTKRERGTCFVFIGYSEVLDYLYIPITTNKSTRKSVEAVASVWDVILKSVQVSRITRVKLFRFFPIL